MHQLEESNRLIPGILLGLYGVTHKGALVCFAHFPFGSEGVSLGEGSSMLPRLRVCETPLENNACTRRGPTQTGAISKP